MTALYSENDPYAAAWLRKLISEGFIAPGVVDERDMREIEAWELAPYTQVHFCAGIGIWSYALRAAGWPDDRPIWTGSFPCQPFSQAGQRKGISDDRHLWPFGAALMRLCKPPIFIGEQVASPDGLAWFDHVSADLENEGYAVGAADLCAAGVEGYHIRQRLYFVGVADDDDDAGLQGRQQRGNSAAQWAARPSGLAGGLADAMRDGAQSIAGNRVVEKTALVGIDGDLSRPGATFGNDDATSGLADAERDRQYRSGNMEPQPERWKLSIGSDDGALISGLADAESDGREQRRPEPNGWCHIGDRAIGRRPGSLHVRSDYADWLLCRDARWRPVEPATFPLADAYPGRVGRLRAYGNALDAETAITFCRALTGL